MKNIFQFSLMILLLGVFVSCKNKTAGEAAKTGAATEVAAPTTATSIYKINPANSKVYWAGTKPTGTHNGTVDIANGQLGVADGKIVSGSFTLDMNTITDLDLEGEWKTNLESHLKGTIDAKADDFFNVRKFPTGTFVISSVAPAPAGGDITHNITGNLTLKGITKSVTIPANIAVMADKITAATPAFTINRTEWGIIFMSKSMFSNLQDKFVEDDISLTIQLEAPVQ